MLFVNIINRRRGGSGSFSLRASWSERGIVVVVVVVGFGTRLKS